MAVAGALVFYKHILLDPEKESVLSKYISVFKWLQLEQYQNFVIIMV